MTPSPRTVEVLDFLRHAAVVAVLIPAPTQKQRWADQEEASMNASRASGRRAALVVHESIFGNTAEIAGVIAHGLEASGLAVHVRAAHDTGTGMLTGRALVVIGAPTHGFALPTRISRRAAGVAPRRGAREMFGEMRTAEGLGVEASGYATFDVRAAPGRWPTTVSAQPSRRLRALGATHLLGERSFHVRSQTGPLHEGERERATTWGRELVELLQEATSSPTRT